MAYYIAIVNIVGFFTAALDKRLAVKKHYRISEKTLFFISVIGGAAGVFLSMLCFNHKTRHKRFMLGLPAIIIFQAAIIWTIYTYIL